MLLKRGDTFRESFGYWDVSGKDSSNPTLIGAYGSGNRPVIASGSKNGFNTAFGGVNNIADEEPPIVGGTIGQTQPGTYDILGRYYYAGLQLNF